TPPRRRVTLVATPPGRVRVSVPEVTFVRSDEYASLPPGYWVIHGPGPFPGDEVGLDMVEAAHTGPHVAQYQQRPGLADHVF
ncbi:hypothetical protein GTY88_14575, partial [Streptomyces sp. SID5926]|nr:hypothetical protein [Streptomyces sp. SID5926]